MKYRIADKLTSITNYHVNTVSSQNEPCQKGLKEWVPLVNRLGAVLTFLGRCLQDVFGRGMTKYRKGPQRTAKDPQKTHKGPQRSITQDHRESAIMRELPDLQQFCLIFFFKLFCLFFCNFVFFVFFVNFGVLMNSGGL